MDIERDVERILASMCYFEGYSVVEAKLTYAAREKLPASAFCGPDRTYPAHDAIHVRNAFARLSTFGGRLSPEVRCKIYRCLVRRAKRFGVEHDPKTYKYGACLRSVQETSDNSLEVINWWLKELGIKK